ncbi:hypothetical protein F4780DRAFT_768456 [Xylariomycetidae sp. FL0641]|nr:hypothetical protein F4780DRAFT_768456 [Xylariomycetidae sp. FL0641]
MSKADVVQRPAAALPVPVPVPGLERSAMAAVAAAGNAAAATPTPTSMASSTGAGIKISARPAPSSSSPTRPGVTRTETQPTRTTTTANTTTTTHSSRPTSTPPSSTQPSPIGVIGGLKRLRDRDNDNDQARDGRTSKSRQRPIHKSMEPPVLSFYGTQPVPLPSRFASLKRRLVQGHEDALEASWGRLLKALREDIRHIEQHGSEVIPSIAFGDIDDPARVAPFRESLQRHGIGVVRGVVPPRDAAAWVAETQEYLETKHEFKPPPAQDPTCFDFFWTPAQVRARAHPHVLRAQRFAMSLWNQNNDDRLATRFPITYADRLRLESVAANGSLTINGAATAAPATPEDHLIAAAAAASTAQIAQVDNGSLERWEQDGYGRCGLYDAIFRGDWEAYDAWDPAGRINATSDLYNGAGACSMMRLFQGILALTVVEPGMIRLLPSPKLSTAYFLLRPFFSPKSGPPEAGAPDYAARWEAYLDAANWQFDREQSTIIHGAVPGHAQRVTAAWHPHLQLDRSLVTPPTLQAGDYIVWHPDQAYQFSNTNYRTTSRPHNTTTTTTTAAGGKKEGGGEGGDPTSTTMLVYTPAAPLTQTNALFLARQRKAFLRGHPGPDFDSTGTGLGSEAPHTGRLGEKEIRDVGGEEGLQAMGLAPWSLSPKASPPATDDNEKRDVDMLGGSTSTPGSGSGSGSGSSHAEAEVVRLANIILFPDRYDFYMPTRASSPAPKEKEKEKEKERERDAGPKA